MTHHTRIIAADEDDHARILEIDAACVSGGKESFLDILPSDSYWIVKHDSETVGFCGMRPHKPDSAFYLHRAAVMPEYRKCGIHTRLIRKRVSAAKRSGAALVYTYVLWDNIASANNLIKCGFKLWIPAIWGGELVKRGRTTDSIYLYKQV